MRKNAERGTSNEVEIVIDGKSIPLTPFPQEIIENTIHGMVSTLKGIPESYKELTITIRRMT